MTFMKVAICLFPILLVSFPAPGQNTSRASAQGKLTVTATVAGSVILFLGPNGGQAIVVANSPAGRTKLVCEPVRRSGSEIQLSREEQQKLEEWNDFSLPEIQAIGL